MLTLDNAPGITVEIVNSSSEIGGIGKRTPGAPAVAKAISREAEVAVVYD